MGRRKPLPSKTVLAGRLFRNALVVLAVIWGALGVGAVGYHVLAGFSWLDAFLNAAMILTGMGPVNPMPTAGAKVFAIVYALFSGVFFLSMTALILAPALQYFLHQFHLEMYGDEGPAAAPHAAPHVAPHATPPATAPPQAPRRPPSSQTRPPSSSPQNS